MQLQKVYLIVFRSLYRMSLEFFWETKNMTSSYSNTASIISRTYQLYWIG